MIEDPFIGQAITLASQGAQKPVIGDRMRSVNDPDAAAKDFEAFFISQMMDQMFAGLATDGLFGGGQAEKVFRGMLNQEYGKAIAEQGGFGLGAMVSRELIGLQEQADQAQ